LEELFVSAPVPAPAAEAPASHLLLSSLQLAAGDELDEPLDPAEHAPFAAARGDDDEPDGDQ